MNYKKDIEVLKNIPKLSNEVEEIIALENLIKLAEDIDRVGVMFPEKKEENTYIMTTEVEHEIGKDASNQGHNEAIELCKLAQAKQCQECKAKRAEGLKDEIRIALIGSMDLFLKWGKRTFKNTDKHKFGDTSDIITELSGRIATAIRTKLKEE